MRPMSSSAKPSISDFSDVIVAFMRLNATTPGIATRSPTTVVTSAAEIDGANSIQVFFRVTLPLLSPILVYTIITAMIGGLQMFDVPQVLTNGKGTPDRASMTMVMYLNNYLKTSKNYGMAGAVSVVLFIISAALSLFVYNTLSKQYKK